MNSTQYLIILITAVVCFCIYVLAEIVRLRKWEAEIKSGNVGANAGRLHSSLAVPTESPSSVPDTLDGYRLNAFPERESQLWKEYHDLRNKRLYSHRARPIRGHQENGYFPTQAQLQEEIRTRLKGGDGA